MAPGVFFKMRQENLVVVDRIVYGQFGRRHQALLFVDRFSSHDQRRLIHILRQSLKEVLEID